MVKRNICLLVNPFAGDRSTIKVLKKVEDTLKMLPLNFRTVIPPNVLQAQQVAIEAAQQNECVAVLGGDGSVNVIAEVLQQQHGVLAVIPGGRGNDFARTLNYPQDPVKACEILVNGKEILVDTALVNHRPFLNICSLGIDSIANAIANRAKWIKGRSVYWYAGLRALFTAKPIEFNLTIDGKSFNHFGYTVAVANSQCYGGGLYLAPQASLQDGLLDVVLIADIKKHQLLLNLPRLFNGTHIHDPGYQVIQGQDVIIRADSDLMLYADGDAISSSPVEIKVVPKSLRVLVPSP